MRRRQLLILTIIVGITLLSAAFGMLQSPRTPVGVISGGIAGAAIGFVLSILETKARDDWARKLRRIPRPVLFIVRTLIYGAAFVAIPQATAMAIEALDPKVRMGDLLVTSNLLMYFGFAFLVNFFMALRRMMGLKTLMALALGRYHRPQEEVRIVAFLDLRGSTQLAERMGTARYHDFLNDVFFDVADPILNRAAASISMSATRSWSPGRPRAGSRTPLASPSCSRSRMRWRGAARPISRNSTPCRPCAAPSTSAH